MKKLWAIALTLLLFGSTGCNALKGLEKDLGRAGKGIEKGASKTGAWLERQGNKMK